MKLNRLFLLLLAFGFLAIGQNALAQISVSVQVNASSDDAEEQGANGSSPGSMDLTSSDLELVRDGNDGDQWVGMRFNNLAVPQGAYITNAYIQFTVDEDDTITGDKFIFAEDVDNSTTFGGGNFNISSRSLTADSVIWTNIPTWPVVGSSGPDQQTPDLSSIVQAVINRPGWANGNSINIIMTGSGERVAESYDGSSGSAPILVVEYMTPIQVSVQVNASSDDAEEQGANGSSPGSMDLTSSDLELVRDGNDGDQWVGMRFNSLAIPQGAFIVDAYIQFTVDEDDTITGDKFIYAEDVDNSTTFGGANFNISTRPLTSASATWTNIPLWPVVGSAGVDQRTSNFANVVQEVINRQGWATGNSINIIMNGTGERVAESYDGSSGSAPVLVVSYLQTTQTTTQVNASSDDAEEQGTNGSSPGSMDLTSSDLELVRDGNDGDQWVGMRFNNIVVPQGAVITNAYIQFTVDEDDTITGDKFIYAEDVDNATTFGGANFNISSRALTSNSVTWTNIPTWPVVGTAGPDQQTPNLALIVQDIVNRPGWAPGNSMNIIMTGTGERVAESYDGSSGSAPQLIISYATSGFVPGGFPITAGSDWKYDDTGVDLGTAWTAPSYNDSAWDFGPAILGYNNGNELTTLDFGPDPNNKYPTTYLRRTFITPDLSMYDSLKFTVLRDDGVIVYVNGTEAFRMNMPGGTVTYNTLASSAVGGADETTYFTMVIPNTLINNDTNVIAVELHQNAVTSSDLSFDLTVEGKLGPIPLDTFPVLDQSNWLYLDSGANLDPLAWKDTTFDDSQWLWGPSPLGYNDLIINTEVSFGSDPNNKYITTYFRKPFYVADVNALSDTLLLKLMRDDAGIVYINGTEVVRSNMPAPPTDYLTLSSTTVAGADETTFNAFLIDKTSLHNGINQLAVEVHQRDAFSSDKIFDLSLEEAPNLPAPGQGCPSGINNHIGCFTSIEATTQTSNLIIPETHAFQMIFKQGETYSNGNGTVPGNHDFTGYVAINGSSTEGYVSVNHENTPGGVSILDVSYNATDLLWEVDSTNAVDFTNNDLVTTTRNCSGGITPWGTVITCEETYNGGDINNDGYEDVGWNVEIDPATRSVVEYGNGIQEKLWAMGRISHENVVVSTDNQTVYYGEDGGTSCVYKFVANTPMDLSSGTLYVLKLDSGLTSGEPNGPTGEWILVPNTTQNDRNNLRSLGSALGGTNFSGVEDVEINPLNGQIYFTSKNNGRIYRFTDASTTQVTGFETFVGGDSYLMNTNSGIQFEPWGGGNDNLSFDDLGNLWVLQDGGRDYIWVVRPSHTVQNPKVELFMSTPSGSEPTGITFTPDHKFMFVSIQHPSSSNTPQVDATGNNVAFDASATIVVARKEFLGPQAPIAGFTADQTTIVEGGSVNFTDTSQFNPTSRSWSFQLGSPASSISATPQITYPLPGTYDVTLIVNNSQGSDTLTKVDYITVVEDPTIGITENSSLESLRVFPNPVNGVVNVEMNLDQSKEVKVDLFTINGIWVKSLQQSKSAAGTYRKQFNLDEVFNASQQVIMVVEVDGQRTSKVLQYIR